ncbi:MAG: DNA methyltransferase [Legionellales bacterium]
MYKTEFKILPLKSIEETAGNPNKMESKVFNGLVESMKIKGWYFEPATVWEYKPGHYRAISGHKRIQAGVQAAIEETNFNVITDPLYDERQARLDLLEANNRAGKDDEELLKAYVIDLLKNYPDADIAKSTGIDENFLIKLLSLPDEHDDEVPDVPEDPVSQMGDVYLLGQHRILCGDATKMDNIKTLMNGIKADLYLSDPPYGVDYTGKTKDKLKIKNDKKKDQEFLEFLKAAFSVVVENIKSGASYYVWHADSEGYNFRVACKSVGLETKQCLIWNKNTMVMGRQDYQWKHEPCLYGWKEGTSHSWYSDRKQTTILNFDRPTRSVEHPTMKPVALFEYLMLNSTKSGDIILDTFLGSGTSIIAAEKTNRICYGMEIDPVYIDVLVERYITFKGSAADCFLVRNGEKTAL